MRSVYPLFSLVLAERWEPYTEACYTLASKKPWTGCTNITGPAALQQCLCRIAEFNLMTANCIQIATVDAPVRNYTVCPPMLLESAHESKNIGLNNWQEKQVHNMVKLVSTQQSLDSTTINRQRADRYSNGIFIYWLSLMAIFTILNMWLWLYPRQFVCVFQLKMFKLLRKYLQFHHFELLDQLGVPCNLEVVILIGFLVLDIAVMFANIPLVTLHTTLPSDGSQLLKHIADRASYSGAKMLPLVVFFGGRNSFLMTLTGWDIKRYNVFHRWIGRTMLLNFIIHGCCYASLKISSDSLSSAMKTGVFQFGTITLIILALIFIQSMRYLRTRHYEIFLTIHIVFWLTVFATGYCHVSKMAWGRQCFWAALGIWLADRGLRIAKMIFNGFAKKSIVTVHENKVVEIAVPMDSREDHCGTFAFVHFLNLQWWQSHPFSYFCDGDFMRFMVSPRAGITNEVNQLAQYRSPQVVIDGPYGTRPNLEMYDTVVFIIGGIGITSALGHLRSLLRKTPEKVVHLHWAVKGTAYLEFVHYLLEIIPGNVLLSIYMSTTKQLSSVESLNNSLRSYSEKSIMTDLHYCLVRSRLNVREIVSSHIYEGSKGALGVIVCGPNSMAVEAGDAVRDSMMDCNQFVELYNHNYSW